MLVCADQSHACLCWPEPNRTKVWEIEHGGLDRTRNIHASRANTACRHLCGCPAGRLLGLFRKLSLDIDWVHEIARNDRSDTRRLGLAKTVLGRQCTTTVRRFASVTRNAWVKWRAGNATDGMCLEGPGCLLLFITSIRAPPGCLSS